MYTEQARGEKCNILFYPRDPATDAPLVQLGTYFLRAFYSVFDYRNDFLYFGINNLFSDYVELHKFPGLLIPYLGLTCVIFPPIIVAFCMDYNYCPRRRRRQRIERMKKLKNNLRH